MAYRCLSCCEFYLCHASNIRIQEILLLLVLFYHLVPVICHILVDITWPLHTGVFIRALLIYTNVNIHFDPDTDVMYIKSNFVVVWLMHCLLQPSVFHFSLIVWKSNKTSHALLTPFMEGYTIFFISDNKNGLQWK